MSAGRATFCHAFSANIASSRDNGLITNTGKVTESFTGWFKLLGQRPRSLGTLDIVRKLQLDFNLDNSTGLVIEKIAGTPQSVHWTVRVMMQERNTECHLLETFETTQATEHTPNVHWQRGRPNLLGPHNSSQPVQAHHPAPNFTVHTVNAYEYLLEDMVSTTEMEVFEQ